MRLVVSICLALWFGLGGTPTSADAGSHATCRDASHVIAHHARPIAPRVGVSPILPATASTIVAPVARRVALLAAPTVHAPVVPLAAARSRAPPSVG